MKRPRWLGYHPFELVAAIAATIGCGPAASSQRPASGERPSSRESTIAADLALPPVILASDGATVFWLDAEAKTLWKVPAIGGPIEKVIEGRFAPRFLALDEASVYFEEVGDAMRLLRIPKAGGKATLVGEAAAGGLITAATLLGGRVFWVELAVGTGPTAGQRLVKAIPATGGAPTLLAQLDPGPGGDALGVTRTAAFLGGRAALTEFTFDSGTPVRGAPSPVAPPARCDGLLSDVEDVFCVPHSGTIVRVSSDGTTHGLEAAFERAGASDVANVAIDATDLYWVDGGAAGKVMRVPKGGGVPTVLARDASPIAVTVDASAVLWSDQAGRIQRLTK